MSTSTPSTRSTDSATATASPDPKGRRDPRQRPGWLRRLLAVPSRIWLRLLAFNVLLVFLPAAGLLTLDTYEQQLLRGQENAMAESGRLLASALAETLPVWSGELDPEHAQGVLENLNRRLTARIRVIDPQGIVLADSAAFGPRRETGLETDVPPPEARESWIYRLGTALYRFYERLLGRPDPPVDPRDERGTDPDPLPFLERPEIRRALEGEYGAASRPTVGQRSLTLNSALPIRHEASGDVVGVVLVSRSTWRILQSLYLVRLAIFRVFLLSVGAAVILSLLLGTTLVRPIHRLRREANQLLDRRGRLKGRFSGSRKLDEIGDLARALEALSHRLSDHLAFTETFAADMAHELKNPLASVRSAAELLGDDASPEDRERFAKLIQGQVARMERILSSAQELTRLDAEVEQEERRPVPLPSLLERILEGYRLRGTDGVHFDLEVAEGAEALTVAATPERLEQLFENLLDNAVSFSPPGGTVALRVLEENKEAVTEIADQGPGIPPEHRDRIFHRFFSYRPDAQGTADTSPKNHLGLGLATVRVLTESYGGRVSASPRTDRKGEGAVFRVELPAGR